MKKKNLFVKIMALILIAAMLAGSGFYLIYMISPSGALAYGADAYGTASDAKAYQKLDGLKTIIQTIVENYKEGISAGTLVDAAYAGVFDSLDRWSVYYASSEEEESFTSTLTNEDYSGIGVTITKNEDGKCYVASVNLKGPAYRAGLKKNDIFVKIDGKDVSSWSLDQVASALRGEEGSTVKLTVLRGKDTLDFSIRRESLSATTVDAEMIEGSKIAYIKIGSFNIGTANDLYLAQQNMLEQGASSFIIDIRDNTGGYMNEALNCAACFLKLNDDVLFYYQAEKEVDHIYVAFGDPNAPQYKTVVLVNEDTASASEAFAAALKDNRAAALVGVNTYGKGVAQQIFQAENGDSFKLSTMYFTGPKKAKIDGVGVKPDYIVYNNGGLDLDRISEISASTIPMDEGKKYMKQGLYGSNVLAAQQRLIILGYDDVKPNGILDDATVEALKDVQKQAGVYVYGMLDFTTIKILDERFNNYLFGTADAQYDKAVELLSK